ncbi:MAG TPA: FecR domain-containing protein [Saprospiraceae bacterium]|nr:FecR domain-containing protein [Saprospiraceae bacterium]HMQ82431.1 FecR domain-containing protein [Saprospiraceae bacterium]
MAEQEKHIDFDNLSVKYFSGEASEAEVRQLEEWVLSSKEFRDRFRQFKKAWILTGFESQSQPIDVEKEWTTTAAQLFTPTKLKPLKSNTQRRLWPYLAVAASVLLLITALFWLIPALSASHYKEVVAQNQVEKNQLPDGTQVALNQYTILRFDGKTDKQVRQVALNGDAFFDVKRDTTHPFVITAKEVVVEVLGTSFYVDARPELPFVQVIVQSGTVSMSAAARSVILTAGETGIFDVSSGELSEKKNEDDNYLAWQTNVLVFDNTDLDKVIFDLNRNFHTQISLAHPALGKCKLTAVFERQSLAAILKIIETTLNLSAKTEGGRIVLSGKGCG